MNRDVGELPAGTYQIEVDEEEIHLSDRPSYRRPSNSYLPLRAEVQKGASTRTIATTPKDLDSALVRDEQASEKG